MEGRIIYVDGTRCPYTVQFDVPIAEGNTDYRARKNGIELKFGDPAEEVPGENIIFPAKPSLVKARDMDLNRLRRSLIKRQAAAAQGRPLTDAEVAYLMEETRGTEEFVRQTLKDLGM